MSTVNLEHRKAIEKLKELAEEITTCLFCTNLGEGDGSSSRPMGTQQVDESGNIWFFSEKDSEKNREIENDNKVRLYYSHPGKNSYMVVNGEATISTDKQKIDALWTPLAKTWFKEGKDDPRVTLIKVSNVNAYFWDTKGNKMINFFKMVASVATGKTLVDAEEGTLQVK